MKLHEALRKILKEFGSRVLMEKRLVFLLADYLAFDEFPAMKEVMKAVATGVWGKDLCSRSILEDNEDFDLYAEYLKKSLVRTCAFRDEFAEYAAECFMFALGLRESVTEPSDKGYSATFHKTSAPEPETPPAEGHAGASGAVFQESMAKADISPSSASEARVPDAAGPQTVPQKAEAPAGGEGGVASPRSGRKPYHSAGNWLTGKNNAPIRRPVSVKAWRSGGAGARYHPEPPEESFPQDPEALYRKGEDFYFGRGVPQDYEEAVKWYQRAADLGNADAMYSLAVMYSHRRGVQRDPVAAGKWRRKADSAVMGIPQ